VSGTIPDGERQGVAFCPAGHRVDALQVDQGLSEAAMIGHAA
jgi:hypothetical protein